MGGEENGVGPSERADWLEDPHRKGQNSRLKVSFRSRKWGKSGTDYELELRLNQSKVRR